MRRFLILFAIIVALIGALIAFQQYNKQHDDLNKEEAAYTLDATTLFDEFSSDEVLASEKYINQILEVNGMVKNVEKNENAVQIFLETSDPMFGIIGDMALPVEAEIPEIGEIVTLRGICSGFLMDVALNRCVLIEKE